MVDISFELHAVGSLGGVNVGFVALTMTGFELIRSQNVGRLIELDPCLRSELSELDICFVIFKLRIGVDITALSPIFNLELIVSVSLWIIALTLSFVSITYLIL